MERKKRRCSKARAEALRTIISKRAGEMVAGGFSGALPEVTPHTLRHTCGKNLVDAGVSLEQVVALLGHESLDPGMIYTKPSHGDLEKAVRKAAGELLA